MKWIYDAVTLKNPMQCRFEFALRTRGMIRAVIKERFGIQLSLASIGRLRAQLGLTFQKPLMRAFSRIPRWWKIGWRVSIPRSGRGPGGSDPRFSLEMKPEYDRIFIPAQQGRRRQRLRWFG